jgi:hypothetical protein
MLRIAKCRESTAMIDFISFSVKCDKPLTIGKPVSVLHAADHRTESFTPVKVCAGRNAPAFELRYCTKLKRLEFKGSPIMFIQGHNAYGSDDLRWLVQQTVPLVFATIKMPMPRDVMRRIDTGDYGISAVDVTKHFRLPSGTVKEFCEWIRVHAPAELKATPAEQGIGVRLLPNSRSTSFHMYDKAHYFMDRIVKCRGMVLGNTPVKTLEHIGTSMLFNRMHKELENVVRIEAKFRRSLTAKRWQLERGSKWRTDSADQLFFTAVNELPLGSITSGSSFEHLINDASLPLEHRREVSLWLDGRDVLALSSSPSSYYRLRQEMLAKYGVDLSRPPPVIAPFNWTDLIQTDNALKTPKWAVKNHYVHTPATLANGAHSPYQRAWLDHAASA